MPGGRNTTGTPQEDMPAPVNTSVPHIARVYNYWLGGKDHFAADRELAEKFIAADPKVIAGVRANRAFLGRAVHFLAAEAGIRQFLDIGTGIPTASNTHEVAQHAAPDSRVVYVDNDGIVAALMDAVPPGSYLAVSHPAADVYAQARAGAALLNEGLASPIIFRTRAAVARFFDGLELVEPGLVSISQWRSGVGAGGSPLANWAGVARKT
jgi:hypothetical protein